MTKLYFVLFLFGFCACPPSVRAQNGAPCSADFRHDTTSVRNEIYFLAADDAGMPLLHYWDFGDGLNSGKFILGSYNASHFYNRPGNYNVTHIVKDSAGTCMDSVTEQVNVNFTVVTCNADFDSSKVGSAYYNGYGFMPVMDSINGSSDSIHFNWLVNGTIVSNRYFFTYVFPVGSNNVCLKVSTTGGCEAEVCKIVFVPRVDSCPLNAGFSSGFGYLADSSDLLRLTFNPSIASDSLTYYWDFGDGGSSTKEFPTHAYPHAGSYNASLTIKNTGDGGCSSVYHDLVYVNDWAQDPCSAVSFKYSVNPEIPDKWTFTIVSDQPVPTDSVQWWISKGQTWDSAVYSDYLEKINPMTYIFPDTGYYRITLSAGPYDGCHQYPYKVIHVDSLVAVSGSSINTYPNPVVNTANFTLTLPDNTPLTIAVFNTMGGEVLYKNLAGMKGKNNIKLSVYDLQPGIYYVGIWYNGGIKTSKFQKL